MIFPVPQICQLLAIFCKVFLVQVFYVVELKEKRNQFWMWNVFYEVFTLLATKNFTSAIHNLVQLAPFNVNMRLMKYVFHVRIELCEHHKYIPGMFKATKLTIWMCDVGFYLMTKIVLTPTTHCIVFLWVVQRNCCNSGRVQFQVHRAACVT